MTSTFDESTRNTDTWAAHADPRPALGPAAPLGPAPGPDTRAAHSLTRDTPATDAARTDTPATGAPTADTAGPDAEGPDDGTPVTDDRAPAEVVTAMVDRVLALAATWTGWNGDPVHTDDRVYTPHKAIRRVADHLVDHLAELEARIVGEETQPDHWHASAVTTPADLAPFTGDDLDEARSRLTRLAGIWVHRLNSLTTEQLDHSPGTGWTFRALAFHVAESTYYADALGELTPTARHEERPA